LAKGIISKTWQVRLLLLLIFLVAVGVRLWFAWPAITGARGFEGDEKSYYSLALSLLESGRLLHHGVPTAYRLPLFPLMLAPFYAFFGPAPFAPQPFIVILNASICLGVYLLGKELFNRQVGLLGAAISAADIYLIRPGAYLLAESLFVFLLLFGMLALERLRRRQAWQWAVIAGLILGLDLLTKANWAPFLPFLMGWIIYTGRAAIWRGLRNALIVVGIMGVFWSAWMVRNYVELGALIPFTTQGGIAYYGLYNDQTADLANWRTFGQWKGIPFTGDRQLSELEADRKGRELALAWIRAHPMKAAGIMLMQVVNFWRAEHYSRYAALFWYGLLIAAVIGYVLAIRQGNPGLAIWVLLAIVMTGLTMVSIGLPRFRIALHPIFHVLAAFCLMAGLHKIIFWIGIKPVQADHK
jgi:4-amino-4-deoxy-L-arabinose transferase-like glycosyltransferase